MRENEVPATCYAEGSYDEVIYCSVEECKHEISREKKSIEKTEHTPGEAVRENEVPATCYAEGSYEEVIYCSVENCKHEISREEKSIEKTDIPVNAHKDLLPGIQVEGNVITVTSELACKVGYQLLDENGNVIEGYISLAGVKVGDNTYTFTIPTPNEAKVDVHSVVVVLSGDVNQDGALTAADKTWLEESMSGDRTLDAIQAFAADVNSNGKVNSADRILLARTLMYIKKLSTTNPIAWYTGNGTGEN